MNKCEACGDVVVTVSRTYIEIDARIHTHRSASAKLKALKCSDNKLCSGAFTVSVVVVIVHRVVYSRTFFLFSSKRT